MNKPILPSHRQAISEYTNIYSSMGKVLSDCGRHADAIVCYRRALQLSPESYQVYNNLGILLQFRDELDEAIFCYHKAVEIKSDYAAAHYNMGNALTAQGKLDEAIACYDKALVINPAYAKAVNNKGNALKSLGRFNEAIICYNKALEINPNYADAYNNKGVAMMEQARLAEALVCYCNALRIKPHYAEAHNNIAITMKGTGQLSAAISNLDRALRIDPEYVQAYNNLGNAYKEIGYIEEAIVCYRKALKIKPDYAEAYSNILFTMNYDVGLDQQTLFSEARVWWQKYNKPVIKSSRLKNKFSTDKRLKIGYVSPDFRKHAVSNFILPLLAAHDRNAVEVFCYAEVRRPDNITDRIKNLADNWRSTVGKPDDVVAEMIRKDRIDILVDLAGHTAGNRLLTFAKKPAPVQVTWLGYPNTTGMSVMDYRLTDDIADPRGAADRFHSETLLRLPNGFLCYAPPTATPEIAVRKPSENSTFTFGSFNNLTKLNTKVIAAWSMILQGVPKSRLLLKSKQFSDGLIKNHFVKLFHQNGIPPHRIRIMPPTSSFYAHLSLYNEIDIGLDPFPYNGTTTTCEALWMGVPVITLCGDRHASRVGASILNRTGLKECITLNEGEYVAKAISMAANLDRLENLKARYRSEPKESPLFDNHNFAQKIEKAYRDIWRIRCSTDPNHSITSDWADNKPSHEITSQNIRSPENKKTAYKRT